MSSPVEEAAHLMGDDQAGLDDDYNPRQKPTQSQRQRLYLALIYSGIGFISIFLIASIFASLHSDHLPGHPPICQHLRKGYTCHPALSHKWGQYSPYYLVPPFNTSTALQPKICNLTSLHLLSRHGARFPTLHKSTSYAATISKIKRLVPASFLKGPYAFLLNYNYGLGADSLTDFGRQQMLDSGSDFYMQYAKLVGEHTPFIRASGQERVVESAQKWAEGFHRARIAASDGGVGKEREYPYPILTIPETPGQNSTLSHTQCPAFERSNTGPAAQSAFLPTWLPLIHERLSTALPATNITPQDTLSLLDLCPFETVANTRGATMSPFCDLFSPEEWVFYDYHQTLGKFYGPGSGSPLGATQGVGWVNELIARLTSTAVKDSTSTNRTLDNDPETFPLGKKVYADFSHDNDMMSIFAAMGLYKGMPELSTGEVMGEEEMGGFGAARTVPFAGRMVVEGMTCEGEGEMVRVVMNGRVLPLTMCGGVGEGGCPLEAFVKGLEFAKSGGQWDECFFYEDVGNVEGQEVMGAPTPP